jgi:hypothetical protein
MDYLKKIGKDPESLRGRELERVRKSLAAYETVFRMLKVEDGGHEHSLQGRGAAVEPGGQEKE